jgi:site-specific DNA-cytosine methylase
LKVLTINTYAGSLLLGAADLGCEIIGSYEDKGFFQPVAKTNFPEVRHVAHIKDWSKQDLSEVVVLAHPPCSWASVQNSSANAKGLDAAAFKCTKQVLEYAMQNGAAGVAIESVMGALAGAWPVHDHYAKEYGYHCYRVLENGCMFGCQWRERFWAVWLKKELAHREWAIALTPNFKTIGEVLQGHEDGPSPPGLELALTRLKEKLVLDAGLTTAQMDTLFAPQEPPHPTTWIVSVLWDRFFKEPDSFPEEKWYIHQDFVGGFSTGVMKFIDPRGLAPVLLADSFWYYNGRILSEAGYKRIMGFPPDYIFPTQRKDYRKSMRMGLSKGVMPPIATWLLDNIGQHLGMLGSRPNMNQSSYHLMCEPELIVDFRIRKEDWPHRKQGLPPLRQYDDEIERKRNVNELRGRGPLSREVLA